jgi:hypothetical protein
VPSTHPTTTVILLTRNPRSPSDTKKKYLQSPCGSTCRKPSNGKFRQAIYPARSPSHRVLYTILDRQAIRPFRLPEIYVSYLAWHLESFTNNNIIRKGVPNLFFSCEGRGIIRYNNLIFPHQCYTKFVFFSPSNLPFQSSSSKENLYTISSAQLKLPLLPSPNNLLSLFSFPPPLGIFYLFLHNHVISHQIFQQPFSTQYGFLADD